MYKRILAASASLAAMAFCASAHAEQATPGAPASASATSGGDQIQELVVTAERRTVNLQKSSVAATVLTGQDLVKKGVVTVDQLQFVSPNLTVTDFGQGNLFNIRGIGKSEGSSTVQSGVVTYRDGVATFPGYFQSEPYYDIANVEVLRGPQGTFAGQNATGGAVFITEQNPTLDGAHGYAQGQYGNYADRALQGAINVPLSDTLALRVATNNEYRDSFYTITGPYTGSTPGKLRENSVRGSLLWKPTDKFQLLLKADYSNIDMGGIPADPATSTEDLFHIGNNAYNHFSDKFGRVVLNMSYTLDNGIALKSITGYQKGVTIAALDADGTNGAFPYGVFTFKDRGDESIWSQEFNIISPDTGPLTWVLGAYYQKDTTVFPPGTFSSGSPPGIFDVTLEGANPKTAAAGFGQVSYKITPALQIQVGLRYTHSTQRNDDVSAIPEYFLSIEQHASESDSKLTGKVALNWTIDTDNFAYAFAATGHKAGGINGPNIAFVPPTLFAPEDVTDYEIGWKSTQMNGHLRTQLGGFYSRYKNFQVTIQDPAVPSISELYNVPSPTTIYGVEASAQAVFGDLSFDVGASYLHSSLGTFSATDPRTLGAPATVLTGRPTSYAPAFTANFGAQYAFHLAPEWTLTPRIDYSHTDREWATLFQNAAAGDHLPARDLVNAEVNLEHQGWLLTAYSTNVGDQHYVAAVSSTLRYAGAPRQYGIRVRKSF